MKKIIKLVAVILAAWLPNKALIAKPKEPEKQLVARINTVRKTVKDRLETKGTIKGEANTSEQKDINQWAQGWVNQWKDWRNWDNWSNWNNWSNWSNAWVNLWLNR